MEVADRRQTHYQANKVKVNERSARWAALNPVKRRAAAAAYKERNRDKIRAKSREYARLKRARLKAERLEEEKLKEAAIKAVLNWEMPNQIRIYGNMPELKLTWWGDCA